MSKAPRSLTALVLVLALLGAGPVWGNAGCAGKVCCGSSAMAPTPSPDMVLARACCCGGTTVPSPCSLKQGQSLRSPEGLVIGHPRVERPSTSSYATVTGGQVASITPSRLIAPSPDPLAGAPPGPLHLQLSVLLC